MTLRTFATALTLTAAANLPMTAQTAPQAPHSHGTLVATTALEPLLPAPEGWTRTKASADRVVVSAAERYPALSAVTVVDGGFHWDGLRVRAR